MIIKNRCIYLLNFIQLCNIILPGLVCKMEKCCSHALRTSPNIIFIGTGWSRQARRPDMFQTHYHNKEEGEENGFFQAERKRHKGLD